MNRKSLIAIGAGIVLVGGWAAFRPELLFVNTKVDEAFPLAMASASRQPRTLATGSFKTAAHETQGSAAIYEVDGKRILRLTDFHTSNGPDVHVYLVAAEQVKSEDTVKKAGFIDLGSLKGTQGDQNYELPAGADPGRYRAVSIWCKRFGVNFGAASLSGES